jgi:hypothetical protein
MRQALVKATGIALCAILLLGIPELVLRLFPSLIAVSVIDRMHPDLRSEIATQLDLPVSRDYEIIRSAERLDKGPDLYLTKPNRPYFRPVDPIDAEAGARDTIHTDARGFCNPERVAKLARYDIATLGGSVPNCASVDGDEVFSTRLGDLLDVGSFNLTVYAVGPYEYNEIIARYFDVIKPRVVIFAIAEANDLRDCRRYLDYLAGDVREKKEKLGGPFRFSYVLAFLKASMESLAKQVSAATRPNFRYSVESNGARMGMNVTNGDRDELRSAKEMLNGTLSPDLYAAPLKSFADLATEAGFHPVVLIVPAAYTVYRSSVAFEDPSIGAVMANYSETQRHWLAENAGTIGYKFLDPTDFLQRRAADGPLLYFPSDIHLTAAGHEALAQAVAESIRSELSLATDAE